MSTETYEPTIVVPTKILLRRQSEWPSWFLKLQAECVTRGIWDIVNPDAIEARDITKNPPLPPPSLEERQAQLIAARDQTYAQQHDDWEALEVTIRGPEPVKPELPDLADIDRMLSNKQRQYSIEKQDWRAQCAKYQAIETWVKTTVDPAIMDLMIRQLLVLEKLNLQQIIKALKKQLAPRDWTIETSVRERYRRVLEDAKRGSVNRSNWFLEWQSAYYDAKAYNVAEIQGPIAIKDFLSAVKAKLAPEWANHQLTELLGPDEKQRTLEDYALWFNTLVEEDSRAPRGQGVFAMLGGRNDQNRSNQGSGQGSDETRECPCRRPPQTSHKWKPEECKLLEYALTGAGHEPRRPISDEHRADIKKRLAEPRWKSLRSALEKRGWKWEAAPKPSESQKPPKSLNSARFPDSVSAAIMDPSVVGSGVFTTLDYSRHPLADSTLLDNCGATHLVNSIDLLVPGSFVKSNTDDFIEAGTTSIPVLGRGKRVMKNLLTGARGKNTVDLLLSEVAVVEGFHVNIVSEARLLKSGVWYCGKDCSLRYGPMDESVVLKTLKRMYNLVFIEYKAHSAYSSTPSVIPTSAGGVIIYATVNRSINRKFRRTRNYLQPRSDSAEVWHLRAGHLGQEALEALVWSARNVKITGIARVKCASCAQTHAKQVISRQPSERRSPRPFFRIHWDLFDFNVGYDGSSWLLMIKDECSGKLFGSTLQSKSQIEVYNTIRNFEHWVKRQYGLSICKIRQDNDRSVIGITGLTTYEIWAKEEGIDLELTPTHTHEPNGSAERAGQEAITKGIKMRIGANLPEKLWPESALAGIYLYNMSPTYTNQMKSPNEVLDGWFRSYFRWYDPQLVTKLTTDLRPNWSGIYAYGARAYPLIKDREAGRSRRAFKTLPRGHIGYLVGYVASTIYRIWVPVLDKVIITRNVTFDEDILYSFELERKVGQPTAIARSVVEMIEEDVEDQDADSILVHDDLWRSELVERNDNRSSVLGGAQITEAPLIEGKTSGVNGTPTERTGLLTPDPTPEPSDGRMQGSMGKEPPPNPQLESGNRRLHETMAREVEVDRRTEQTSAQAATGQRRQLRPKATKTAERPHEIMTPGVEAREQIPGYASARNPRIAVEIPIRRGETEERSHENMTRGVEAPTKSMGEGLPPRPQQMHEPEASNALEAAPPKQKWERKKFPPRSRQSERLKDRSTEPRSGAASGSAVFSTIEEHNAAKRYVQNRTFLADHHEWSGVEGHLETVYAVIAASFLQKQAIRLGAAPSRPRIHQSGLPRAPKHWKELDKHLFGEQFKDDCRKELENLKKRNCWRVIPISETTTKLIPLKWVFTYKVDAQGFLEKCKSRIVVRGDLQAKDSIESTYAATLAARSFRIAMALAAQFDLEAKQYDVVNAFVNAVRSSDGVPVLCSLPDGFKIPGMCAVIDRALYGLRDSPALWYKDFSSTLTKIGLSISKEEPCLFMSEDRKVFVLFFVDDILMLYHNDDQRQAQQIIDRLKTTYDLRDLEDVEWFLGVRVIRDRPGRKLWLAHDTYIEKIARKFEVVSRKSTSTPLPMLELQPNPDQATALEVKTYQEMVGSILYTAIMIRPDVAFAASKLSHFLTNPSSEHRAAALHCLTYLWGTRFLAIQYGNHKEAQLVIASDASFADDPVTRRSSQGYIMSLFGGLIVWKATRQDTVTTSTTEAELLGVERTAKESMALARLFRDIALELGEMITIFCDNQQTIRLIVSENERITTKLRHVDIQNMWLRQEHSAGSFLVSYLATIDMPADGLTKNLSRQKFEHFRSLLNLADIRGKLETLN